MFFLYVGIDFYIIMTYRGNLATVQPYTSHLIYESTQNCHPGPTQNLFCISGVSCESTS